MAYASPGVLAKLHQLDVLGSTIETIEDGVHKCVACGDPVPPINPGTEAEFVRWAEARAARGPRRLHIADECPSCAAQLAVTVGLPYTILNRVLNAVRGPRRAELSDFLRTHFVFALCRECADGSPDEEVVSAKEIERRYRDMLMLLHGTNHDPEGTTEIANELALLIAQAVQARDEDSRSA
jgi:hypothetical protein